MACGRYERCRAYGALPARRASSHRVLRLRRAGFTLIELITSITVGVILCGMAGSLVWNASRQRAEVAARGELVDTGAIAMEKMLRYLREIPQGETSGVLNGTATIDSADSSAISINKGAVLFRHNSSDRTVEMSTDNGSTWYTLAKDVDSLSFGYWNRAGTALTSFPLVQNDREGVRRISVELGMSRVSQSTKLRTSLYLRAFMDEVSTDVGS